MTTSGPNESQLQSAIEQLYAHEGLTDNLTDETATLLLNWGEQQLKTLANLNDNRADPDLLAYQLQRLMRAINRLIGQQAELSETEMVQKLTNLVEQAIQFALQTFIVEGRAKHDQETQFNPTPDNPPQAPVG